jgi:hypothetical protein
VVKPIQISVKPKKIEWALPCPTQPTNSDSVSRNAMGNIYSIVVAKWDAERNRCQRLADERQREIEALQQQLVEERQRMKEVMTMMQTCHDSITLMQTQLTEMRAILYPNLLAEYTPEEMAYKEAIRGGKSLTELPPMSVAYHIKGVINVVGSLLVPVEPAQVEPEPEPAQVHSCDRITTPTKHLLMYS